jgi:hypothetical protein
VAQPGQQGIRQKRAWEQVAAADPAAAAAAAAEQRFLQQRQRLNPAAVDPAAAAAEPAEPVDAGSSSSTARQLTLLPYMRGAAAADATRQQQQQPQQQRWQRRQLAGSFMDLQQFKLEGSRCFHLDVPGALLLVGEQYRSPQGASCKLRKVGAGCSSSSSSSGGNACIARTLKTSNTERLDCGCGQNCPCAYQATVLDAGYNALMAAASANCCFQAASTLLTCHMLIITITLSLSLVIKVMYAGCVQISLVCAASPAYIYPAHVRHAPSNNNNAFRDLQCLLIASDQPGVPSQPSTHPPCLRAACSVQKQQCIPRFAMSCECLQISLVCPASPAYIQLPAAAGTVRGLAAQKDAGLGSSYGSQLMAVATERAGLQLVSMATNNAVQRWEQQP